MPPKRVPKTKDPYGSVESDMEMDSNGEERGEEPEPKKKGSGN